MISILRIGVPSQLPPKREPPQQNMLILPPTFQQKMQNAVQPRQNTATDTQRFGFIDVADGQLLACGKIY